jgi:hypothetical protein
MRELKGITVAHALPGRVRLKIRRVKENPELARQAQEKLARVPGIQKVEADPATGSLLILYDLAMLAPVEALGPLGEIFAELFPEVEMDEMAAGLQELTATETSSASVGPFTNLFGMVGASAAGLTRHLNLILPLGFLFLGVRSLLTSKERPLPAWYDYLWFGLSTFVMLNRQWLDEMSAAAPVPEVTGPARPTSPPPGLKAVPRQIKGRKPVSG